MKSFIESLKLLSKKNFPVNEVSDLILKYKFTTNSLNKYSHFSEISYTRNMIYKNPDFEVLLICWSKGQMAPIHGHEGEKCWFKVISGELKIYNYKIESTNPLKLKKMEKINAPAGYLDGPADIHSVKNLTSQYATSLHVYAKPYDACDIYNIEKGIIERLKLSYHSINGALCK